MTTGIPISPSREDCPVLNRSQRWPPRPPTFHRTVLVTRFKFITTPFPVRSHAALFLYGPRFAGAGFAALNDRNDVRARRQQRQSLWDDTRWWLSFALPKTTPSSAAGRGRLRHGVQALAACYCRRGLDRDGAVHLYGRDGGYPGAALNYGRMSDGHGGATVSLAVVAREVSEKAGY